MVVRAPAKVVSSAVVIVLSGLGASRWLGRAASGVYIVPILTDGVVPAVKVRALYGDCSDTCAGVITRRTIHSGTSVDKHILDYMLYVGGAMVIVLDVLNPELNDTTPQKQDTSKERAESESRNNARRTRLQVISITGELVDVEV